MKGTTWVRIGEGATKERIKHPQPKHEMIGRKGGYDKK